MTLLSIRVQLEVLELPKTSRLTFRLLPDDIYQHSDAHFNEKNDKDRDGGQLSPRISIRETRAYPYQKGECDK